MVLYEYINRLNQWLESTTFNDSPTIRTEKNDAGWTFHVKNMPETSSSGSNVYNGYFAVTNNSTDEVVQAKVAYGRCRINITDFEMAESNITITGNGGYVYLQAIMDEDGTINTPTIEFSENYFTYEDNTFKGLLGVVNTADSKITSISQVQYGFLYGIAWGQCSE